MFRPAMLVSWLTEVRAERDEADGRSAYRLTARPRPWDACGCAYTGWAAIDMTRLSAAVDEETGFLLRAESYDGTRLRCRYEVTDLRLGGE